MDDIHALIAVARRRARLTHALRRFSFDCTLLSGVAFLLVIIDRLPAEPFLDWWWIGIAFACIAIIAAVIDWSMFSPGDLALAARIDDRLELDDRLATAIHASDRQGPVAMAAVQDGLQVAADPRTREKLRRDWRVQSPVGWWAAPLLVLAVVITSTFGQADLFTPAEEKRPELLEAGVNSDQAMQEVVASIESQPQLKEAMQDLLAEMEAEQALGEDDPRTEEQSRREALKRMTEIERRLEEIGTGETGQAMEAMRKSLEQLDVPEDGAARELAEALAKGDFSEAIESLKELQEELESGEMDDASRQAMAEQLESLAEELEALAKDQEALKEALKQAGLDEQLAGDPQAMQQAVEQASQLTEQQREQLMEMIKSQEAAAKACENLGKACEQMAKQCQGAKPGQKPGQQMGEQLSKLEQIKEMLQQAKSSSSMCRSQCRKLGRGLSRSDSSNKPGGGKEGKGGSEMDVEETETSLTMEQAGDEADGGRVIGEQQVEGPLVTGESNASFEEIITRSAEGFDDAFNEARLPRKYHELIKHYFGDADEVTDAVEYDASRTEDAEPTTENAEEVPGEDPGSDPESVPADEAPSEDDEGE